MLTTMTRALCNNGMMALFGISKLTSMTDADPSLPYTEQREEMITKFKIPRDACMYKRERESGREIETEPEREIEIVLKHLYFLIN